jgi:hypothetical protein
LRSHVYEAGVDVERKKSNGDINWKKERVFLLSFLKEIKGK